MSAVIFAGEDSFRLRLALKKFLEKEASGLPVQVFDSDSGENLHRELEEFFKARTLWRERRVAVAKTAVWKGKLPEVNDPDLLILVLDKSPADALSKKVRVEAFPTLKGAVLSKWIREAAEEFGNTADASLVSALIELHGSDTGALWNELFVLSCFKPGEKLSADDLKAFRSWMPQVRDFAFVEAVLAKDRKQALRLMLASLNEGISPLAMLGSLETHFRAMLVAKFGGKAAAEFFSGKHPYWVSKIDRASAAFGETELKNYLVRLWRTETAIKTGRHAAETALEEFVIGA